MAQEGEASGVSREQVIAAVCAAAMLHRLPRASATFALSRHERRMVDRARLGDRSPR